MPLCRDGGHAVKRQPGEEVYHEGHAVAFMAWLARNGGEVTFTAGELERAHGWILRRVNPDRTVTYRLTQGDPR